MLLRTAPLPRLWSRDIRLELGDDAIEITDVRREQAESIPYGQLVDLLALRRAFWVSVKIAYTSNGQTVRRSLGGFRANPHDVTARVASAIDQHARRHVDVFSDALNRFLSEGPLKSLVDSRAFIRRSQLEGLAFPTFDGFPLLKTEAFRRYASAGVRQSVEAARAAAAHALQSVDAHNEAFCQSEILAYSDLFDSLESYPLTGEQRRAIVHDEDANLVVAGAGSGKTSVVMGKVAYLLTKGLCEPQDILLLAYTAKAAAEMKERIQNKSGFSVDVHTFHSLGLSILAEAEGRRPALSRMAEDPAALQSFIDEAVRSLLRDPAFASKLLGFFSYYLQPVKSEFDFDKEGLHIDYLAEQGVSTLRDQATEAGARRGYRTINRDNVRSMQECRIANFFYVNNVEYEYERAYPHKPPWAGGQYRPDFYLPKHDLYIEHFGVDRRGNTAPYVDRLVYASQMQDKRRLHEDNGTSLVETYSYEHHEGTWEADLKAKLGQHGVRFQPMSPAEFERVLDDTKLTNRFTSLASTFLHLFKSAGLEMDEVRRRSEGLADSRRAAAFLDIFERIYGMYRGHLTSHGEIDFSDMINLACEQVQSGRVRRHYRYVIVDEYQDISYARYKLVRALLQQNEGSRLFCVGDDWQSIYRFTGSDISLMASFGQFFGHHKQLFLTQTFRYPRELLDLSSRFIQANPRQIPKDLAGSGSAGGPCVHVLQYAAQAGVDAAVAQAIEAVDRTCPGGASVFVLTRYNFTEPNIFRSLKLKHRSLDITHLTAHRSKGLEADYVIIADLVKGKYGFPAMISDDPLVEIVLAEPDGFPYSEERRLFYVALTRARKGVFLCAPVNKPSSFVTELLNGGYELTSQFVRDNGESSSIHTERMCPACESGQLVPRSSRYGGFFGCSNYPYCTYIFRERAEAQ